MSDGHQKMKDWPTPVPTPKGQAIDEMDAALDLIRTAELALYADGWVNDDAIEFIRGCLEQGIKRLRPVREAVNVAHGEGRI